MWQVLVGFLMAVIVPLAVKLLLGLGIGFVTYTGADFAISEAETYIFTTLSTVPSNMYSIIAMAGFVDGIKIMFAGYSAFIGVRVATAALTRMSISNPT